MEKTRKAVNEISAEVWSREHGRVLSLVKDMATQSQQHAYTEHEDFKESLLTMPPADRGTAITRHLAEKALAEARFTALFNMRILQLLDSQGFVTPGDKLMIAEDLIKPPEGWTEPKLNVLIYEGIRDGKKYWHEDHQFSDGKIVRWGYWGNLEDEP